MPKSILLIGATGFIGSEIARMLVREGHAVTGLARDIDYGRRILARLNWVQGDLRALLTANDWQGKVKGHDIVINASGALQSGLRDNVNQVQFEAIAALIEACKIAETGHFIQISASNADQGQSSDFMESKAKADALLAASGLSHTLLRPGLVIGRNAFGGTEMVRMAAALPWVVVAPFGTGKIQCVALADVLDAVNRSVARPEAAQGQYDLVERPSHDLAEIFEKHRQWLGFAPCRFRLRVPVWIVRPLTAIADGLGWLGWRSPLRSNSIAALMNGVSGNADEAEKLLGRPPKNLDQTLAELPAAGKADRWHARIATLYPLALASLLLLWLGSGVLGLVKADQTAALIAGQVGESSARLLVFAGSIADIAVGLGLLFRPWLKAALLGSVLLTLGYWAGSALLRPDLWLDPLAPMLKTAPALILSLACLAIADER
ncbi:MAG: SDR family oxidoreductase [Sphingorhabdus sp.]|uniref:SDR family oxidoreductase n=1 Tax=Sphingorhabdus sp. TaxID=1902408 RepID=UPI003C9B585E